MYSKIKSHLNGQSKKEYATFSRKIQETITDEDVQFYIQKAEQWYGLIFYPKVLFVFILFLTFIQKIVKQPFKIISYKFFTSFI